MPIAKARLKLYYRQLLEIESELHGDSLADCTDKRPGKGACLRRHKAADLLADRLEEGGQSGRASRVRGKKSK